VDDYALVLNAGSSSLKFCVFARPPDGAWRLEARGQIEGIGTAPRLAAKDGAGEKLADQPLDAAVRDGRGALDSLAAWLRSRFGGARVLGVGHRVVHGGARFAGPAVVTPQVLEELRALVPLAPLHQPHNLAAIEAVFDRLPGVPQVACFDTSFHRGQPAVAELVPLPRELCRSGLQRYGFHGLSYEYVASVMPETAPGIARGRVVVAHLGSGASVCALRDGKSVDCSFGFTALDGLCMGTRPGALDPGVVLHLFQGLGLSAAEVEAILYKKSGLLGISGVSNDMRDLVGNDAPGARLAVDYFVYQATKQIGALAAVLGGIDGLVFTAGIGENSAEIRRRIGESSAWLGIEIDPEANARKGPRISTTGSRVSAWVVPTNEELMIARHTGRLLGLTEARA
jgi:acetate kinase